MEALDGLADPKRKWNIWSRKEAKIYTVLGAGGVASGTLVSILSYTNNVHRLGLCTGIVLCTAGSIALVEALFMMLDQKRKDEEIRKFRMREKPEFYEQLKKYLELEIGPENLSDEMVDEAAVEVLNSVGKKFSRSDNDARLNGYIKDYLIDKIRILERLKYPDRFACLPGASQFDEISVRDVASNLRGLSASAEWYFRGFMKKDPNKLVPTPDSDVERYLELVNRGSPAKSSPGTSLLSRQIEQMENLTVEKSLTETLENLDTSLPSLSSTSDDECDSANEYSTPSATVKEDDSPRKDG